MIRKASFDDLKQIYALVKEATLRMNSEGNHQWDADYPTKKILRKDVTNGHLFIKAVDGEVLGIIVLNFTQPNQYTTLEWNSDARSLIIHRMAVKENTLGKGVGTELVQFAEQHARHHLNVAGIRTDTYFLNKAAQQLFTKLGYRMVGAVSLDEKLGDFYCYETVFPEIIPTVRTGKRGRKAKAVA